MAVDGSMKGGRGRLQRAQSPRPPTQDTRDIIIRPPPGRRSMPRSSPAAPLGAEITLWHSAVGIHVPHGWAYAVRNSACTMARTYLDGGLCPGGYRYLKPGSAIGRPTTTLEVLLISVLDTRLRESLTQDESGTRCLGETGPFLRDTG